MFEEIGDRMEQGYKAAPERTRMRLPAVFAYAAVRRRRGRRGIAVDLSHDYFFTLILKYSKKPCKRSICKAFLLSRKRGIRVKVARFSLDIKAFFTGWGTKEICTVLYQCYRADMKKDCCFNKMRVIVRLHTPVVVAVRNPWVKKAISKEKLTKRGLVSPMDYYLKQHALKLN
jgi:hypothetical protein